MEGLGYIHPGALCEPAWHSSKKNHQSHFSLEVVLREWKGMGVAVRHNGKRGAGKMERKYYEPHERKQKVRGARCTGVGEKHF